MKFVFAAFGACALTACTPDMPIDLLAPLNPALATRTAPPQDTPTRGLKPFAPAGTKDWLVTDPQPAPPEQNVPNGMRAMPGMGNMK